MCRNTFLNLIGKGLLIIGIYLLLTNNILWSQNSFQVTFRSALDERITDMIQLHNGSIIGVGSQRNTLISQYSDVIIWSIKQNGDTLTKVIYMNDTLLSFMIAEPSDLNYFRVFGGLSIPPLYDLYNNYVFEIDTSLNIVSRRLISTGNLTNVGIYKIFRTNSAIYGLITATESNGFINPGLIKLDNDYNLIDTRTYPFNNSPSPPIGRFFDIIPSPDSSQIWCFAESLTPQTASVNDLIIFDTTLNLLRIKEFPQTLYPIVTEFRNCSNAKLITDSSFLFGGNYLIYNAPLNDLQQEIGFAVFDTSMSLAPVHTFGAADTTDYGGFLGTFDFNTTDSIYFTGTKRLVAMPWPPMVSWIWAGMFDHSYNPYYIRCYGGDAQYNTMKIIRTSDGGSAICAQRYDYKTQNAEWDVCFIKLTPEGLITNQQKHKECPYQPFSIYPNPGTDGFNLLLVAHKAQFALYNMEGTKIIDAQINEGENLINTSDLSRGCYLITVTNPSGEVFTQKWIKN